MKNSANSERGSKLWLALLCGMVCSSVLMLTNHSHAAIQVTPSAQSQGTVVITAKRMSEMEKGNTGPSWRSREIPALKETRRICEMYAAGRCASIA